MVDALPMPVVQSLLHRAPLLIQLNLSSLKSKSGSFLARIILNLNDGGFMEMSIAANIHHDQIRDKTFRSVNRKIDENTERMIADVTAMGHDAVLARLDELDREWDINRVLMVNFGVLVFPQLLAARKNKKWLIGPLIQTPFMLFHAFKGWCPPLLWWRPLGFRTRHEIQAEREELIKFLERTKLH